MTQKIVLRLPNDLIREAEVVAKFYGVSLDALVIQAILEKIQALRNTKEIEPKNVARIDFESLPRQESAWPDEASNQPEHGIDQGKMEIKPDFDEPIDGVEADS